VSRAVRPRSESSGVVQLKRLIQTLVFYQYERMVLGLSQINNPPRDCWSGKILDIYYNGLPHWVVDFGCYALTVRCADSLPVKVLERLKELVSTESSVKSLDKDFLEASREHFKVMEHYLDRSLGECPFRAEELRRVFADFLAEFQGGLSFRHWVVMPNHLHLITEPLRFESIDAFKCAIKDFKLRSTFFVNQYLGRSGKLWMPNAYDRWIRNELEYNRWVRYLRENPTKAGLCAQSVGWVGLR
jgi:REP element-mobilizing transposase RayT